MSVLVFFISFTLKDERFIMKYRYSTVNGGRICYTDREIIEGGDGWVSIRLWKS